MLGREEGELGWQREKGKEKPLCLPAEIGRGGKRVSISWTERYWPGLQFYTCSANGDGGLCPKPCLGAGILQ
jgi:hypothetical protein